MSTSTILRRVALVLTCLFAVAGILFGLGNVFEDPGGWSAALLAAAVLVPLIVLVLLAIGRPEQATAALSGAVVLYAVWAAVTIIFDPVDLPTVPFIAVILAVPIAVIGQRHPWHAGTLLMAAAAIPLVVILVRFFTEADEEGPGLSSLFGTSTGVVVIPLALLAVLFLVAGSTHPRHTLEERPPTRPLPPAAMTR